ncbi:MAG: alpha-E domain-containing protein [Pseudomonadota bacterium]
MLGKTANGLFWLSRYLERAENTARLIETGHRIALTRLNAGDEEWRSTLSASGGVAAFEAVRGAVTREAAIDWMLRDKDNTSSIRSNIANARQNARLVRAAITGEVWEAINATHMSAAELLARRVATRDLPAVLRTIRQNTALVRGMVHGTMMRNDNYDFLRLGTFLERADNTARILDVKYYVLLPSASSVGSSIDNVQWESILRSLGARGGFRMEHGGGGGALAIAHFLILDNRMPRSLAFCINKLQSNLRFLTKAYDVQPESCAMLSHLERDLLDRDIASIFDYGLHEYIQAVLARLAEAGRQIEVDFRFTA